MPFIKIQCKVCPKEFIGENFKSRTSKYCSRICMAEAFKKPKITLLCKTCNKEFYKTKFTSKFCSVKCIRYSGDKTKLNTSKGKGFWQLATPEEKLDRIKKEYDRLVIKQEGCWGWNKAPLSNGYAFINTGTNKIVLAHRASWMIHFGPIPDKKWVLHKCDTPICTNPTCLFIGTAKDNSDDKINKNRHNACSGINHYNVKLVPEQVIEIKKLIKQGYSQRKLANMFNISASNIQNIADGKTWKFIGE